MSETNLAIAERFLEDSTQTNLERFLEFMDSDAEVDFSELDRPYGQVFRGRERIETLFHEMTGPWSEIHVATTKPIVHGENVVLDVERTARSRRGAFAVSSTLTARLTIRDGKITYLKLFEHRADALKAAGLSE